MKRVIHDPYDMLMCMT